MPKTRRKPASSTPAARRKASSKPTAKIVVGPDGIERYEDGMRVNYDIPADAQRGKYAHMFVGRTVRTILMDDDLATAFPTSKSVLTALRKLARERAVTAAAKPRRRKAG